MFQSFYVAFSFFTKTKVSANKYIFTVKAFKKNFYVKQLKMDTKKQVLLLEYHSIEIHPSKIKSMVKNAGYEVSSIKWLKKKEPNRYNKP